MTLVVPDGIDPELARAAALQPDLDYAHPVAVRAALRRAFALATLLRPAAGGAHPVTVSQLAVPARQDAPEIPVRRYEPACRPVPSPALVFFHGGAFVAGDLDTEDARCRELAARTGTLVLSVGYRLAPEHPFPAGFEDCYDVVAWVSHTAPELGVDPARLAVGGSSAGGALAAAVALAARDLGGPRLALQMLLYPVLDDTLGTGSMTRFVDTPGWNGPNSRHMWRHYLVDTRSAGVSPYAAPARATSLTGLPPAYVLTAEFDPLRDEGVEYAVRLLRAGVSTELHQFAGTFHGFDAAAPNAEVSRRSLDEHCAVLARARPVRAPQAGQPAVSRR